MNEKFNKSSYILRMEFFYGEGLIEKLKVAKYCGFDRLEINRRKILFYTRGNKLDVEEIDIP